jgi:hypothetical protein
MQGTETHWLYLTQNGVDWRQEENRDCSQRRNSLSVCCTTPAIQGIQFPTKKEHKERLCTYVGEMKGKQKTDGGHLGLESLLPMVKLRVTEQGSVFRLLF